VGIGLVNLELACCSLEVASAITLGLLVPSHEPSPSVLVISGTITGALVPTVSEVIAALPDAKVLAFGACACSGGPYWDAPTVIPGVNQLTTVSMYVPGCPPRPQALVSAISELARP